MIGQVGHKTDKFLYEISVDDEKCLIFLVVQGVLNRIEQEKIIIETRSQAAETGYNIFCDITRATITNSMAEWFYLARNKEVYPTFPTEKTAVLIHPDAQKLYQFVGNVTRNASLNTRIFVKEEEARAWLKKVS